MSYVIAQNNIMHGLWMQRDGELIHVSEMETSHIRNCINMLKRNNSPLKEIYIPMFEKELKGRGHKTTTERMEEYSLMDDYGFGDGDPY